MDKNEIYEKHKKYLAPCVSHYYQEPVIFDRGKGKYLYDIDGKEYLDFFGGIVTISVGHCDEEITSKTYEQMKRLQHTSTLYPTFPDHLPCGKVGPDHSGKIAEVILHQQRNRGRLRQLSSSPSFIRKAMKSLPFGIVTADLPS